MGALGPGKFLLARRALVVLRTRLAAFVLVAACSSGNPIGPPLAPLPSPLLRGPVVADVRPDSAVVTWITETSGTAAVDFGETTAFGSVAATTSVDGAHTSRLEGLAAGATYHYRLVFDGAVVGEAHAFRTAPADPQAPFRFVAVGDSGDGSWDQYAVAEGIALSDPDFVIHTGDVNYETGDADQLDLHYFGPYRGLLDHVPFYLTLGNHDFWTDDGQPLLDAVVLPRNDADQTSRFYAFSWANTRFVALDTNSDFTPGSVQRTWLEAELAVPGPTWRVVFFHHAPYTTSKTDTGDVRAELVPVFEQFAVDLVVSGHAHNYERSYPIRAGTLVDEAQDPDYVDPGGPIYVVTGGGGKSLHPLDASWFTAYSEAVYHHVVVEVDGASLTVTAIREDGSIIERFTVAKT
jgi:hypothetical protein